MSRLWQQRLRPSYLANTARRVARKLADRITRPHERVVHLPAHGPARGRALVSFWIDAFLLSRGKPVPLAHTHYWESRRLAETWSELGFEVDVIHWTNQRFVPRKPYDVLVDVRLNLERLAPLVGEECLKIQHIETGHHRFHNRAQLERLAALEARRGLRLQPVKLVEENRAIDTADFATTTGNDFTIGTYAHAGKRIWRIPISAPHLYPSPADRDFEQSRRRFMWYGSGGLVHKGLDLVLDAFAGLPDLELLVLGPIDREREFQRAYARELYELPNIRTVGWVDHWSEEFLDVLRTTSGLVYPSCSEGGGGSVITCLHGGLIPIVTWETSVDVHDFGWLLPEATVETIRETVTRFSERPARELRDQALAAWEHARSVHTRERFAAAYRQACEEILDAHRKARR